MRLVILGAPGAGKGTQAEKISKKFEIPHISTGDILRKEIKEGSESGLKAKAFVESGKLVPDELIVDIIEDFLKSGKAKDGFLMDGFPRNIAQAKIFSTMLDRIDLNLDRVINIEVDDEEIIKRLGSRRICTYCHQISSCTDDKQESICPECGAELIKRKDDEEEVIRHRLQVYEKETSPLTEYYREKGILVDIKGSGAAKEVTGRIFEKI